MFYGHHKGKKENVGYGFIKESHGGLVKNVRAGNTKRGIIGRLGTKNLMAKSPFSLRSKK